MKTVLSLFLPVLLATAYATGADLTSVTAKELPSLVALYKEIHAQPELSLHEEQTAARLATELRAAGLDVTENVGAHGLVGILKNGDGPVILVRTELDALPVKEQTGLPYASTVITKDDTGTDVPVMHACGHDIHMACLVGTARVLSQMRDQWSGTLVMIGQPAEERVLGARLMLRAGLFSKFPSPDKALALHCSSDLASGTVGIVEGYALGQCGFDGHRGAWRRRSRFHAAPDQGSHRARLADRAGLADHRNQPRSRRPAIPPL